MAQLQNKDILNAIRDEQSAEYQNNIPVATGLNDLEVYASLEAYPTAKNEFINTLTNRIGRQIFFDKVFNNPFKMLHKGLLPYGKTVEQLFVEMAEEKGFKEHFSGSTSNEGDLIGIVAPKVKADYITQNFEYKFKTSISDLQLKGAFTNQFGLMNLINKAVNSLLSSTQYSEFRDMKKILTNKTADSTGGSKIGTGLVQKMYTDPNTKANSFFPVGSKIDGKTVAKGVRTWANKLIFPSTKYNLAGVKTWTSKEDLVLFVTPELQAELDVEVLATAFNVSSADVNVRTILVDDLGQTAGGQDVVCILADKDIIQAYDTVNTTTTFYNADKLATNYFAHKHGIMAGCSYANAIIFVKGDSIA